MDFGNTGYSFDIVNGLQKFEGGGAPMGSGPGGKMTNRDRLTRHEADNSLNKFFIGGVVLGVGLLLFRMFALGVLVIAGMLYWAYWSNRVLEEAVNIDPATGAQQWVDPADPRAKFVIGGWQVDEMWLARENQLIDILASAKTLPAEMDDSTVEIKCVEIEEAFTVFHISIAPVNGVVAFFQKSMKDIAASFGDPDRYEFVKIVPGEGDALPPGWSLWRLTVYEMPKNISAGVSW